MIWGDRLPVGRYNRPMLTSAGVILLLQLGGAAIVPAILPPDSDNDGLPDKLEQELLAKFAPRFMISVKECDGEPAEFRPNSGEPRLLARNGSIYGQVFVLSLPERPGHFIEIHYFHLWNRDCGLNGHDLDAEHVSVLLRSETGANEAADWKAVYWYAAAHEDTICDISHGARASLLDATQHGPAVWISGGKHSSFLSPDLCKGGCGGDDCSRVRLLNIHKIVNLGERAAPMNGSAWIESLRWPLAEKMSTDFHPAMLARLESGAPAAIFPANDSQAPAKAMVLAGGTAAEALATAQAKTGAALSKADDSTSSALNKAAGKVGRSVGRAARVIWRLVSSEPD